MKIDLKALGLTEDSTFADIQDKLNATTVYTQDEVDAEKNAAAAGARKAAIASSKKNILSDDDMKDWKNYKQETKRKGIKEHEVLQKFSPEDQDLLIDAKKLTDLDGDELEEAIQDLPKSYSKRILNKLPKDVKKENNENNDIEDDDDSAFFD